MKTLLENFKAFLEQEDLAQRSVELGLSAGAANNVVQVIERIKKEAQTKTQSEEFKKRISEMIEIIFKVESKRGVDVIQICRWS